MRVYRKTGEFWTRIYPFIQQAGEAGVTEHDIANHLNQDPSCLNIKTLRQRIKHAKDTHNASVRIKKWVGHIPRSDSQVVLSGSMYSYDPVWVVGEGSDEPHPNQDRINVRHAKRNITLAAKAKNAKEHAAAVERARKYNPGVKIPENWGETPWIRKVDAHGTKIPTQVAQDPLSSALFSIVKSGVSDHAHDDETDPGQYAS